MDTRKLAIIGLLLILTMGCMSSRSAGERLEPSVGSAELGYFDENYMMEEASEDRAFKSAPAVATSSYADTEDLVEGPSEDVSDQKIIYTGTLEMEVEDFDEASYEVRTIAKAYGGFISDSNIYTTPAGKKRGYVTLRVPQVNFQDMIDDVSALGKVETQNTQSQDVTLEYTDLNSRLTNLQRQEGRLLDLLDRADNISDILTIEKELVRIREDIEVIQGRLNYLDNKIDLATLTVVMHEPEPIETEPVRYSADIEVKDLGEAIDSLKAMAEGAGGYISSSIVDEDDPVNRWARIEVNIPQTGFADVEDDLEALGKTTDRRLEGVPLEDASVVSRAYIYLDLTEQPSVISQITGQDWGVDDSITSAVEGFINTLKAFIVAVGLFLPTAILALIGYGIIRAVAPHNIKKYMLAYLAVLSFLSIESGGGVLLLLLIGYLVVEAVGNRGK
jgi:hypothetical protein